MLVATTPPVIAEFSASCIWTGCVVRWTGTNCNPYGARPATDIHILLPSGLVNLGIRKAHARLSLSSLFTFSSSNKVHGPQGCGASITRNVLWIGGCAKLSLLKEVMIYRPRASL